MTEQEHDEFARALYNARSFGAPISDEAWQRVKEVTPEYYRVLRTSAQILYDNG